MQKRKEKNNCIALKINVVGQIIYIHLLTRASHGFIDKGLTYE